MTPEDRKTIEEALERAKSILDTTDGVLNEGMIIKVDGAFHRNIRSAVAESDRALALLRAEPEAREPMGYTATECSEIARKRYADEPRKTFQQQQYAQGLEDGYGHALFEHIGK